MTLSRKLWTELADTMAKVRGRGVAEFVADCDARVLELASRPVLGRHGNRTTEVNGVKFQSKLESDRYRELLLEVQAGAVCWFLRQVPFDVAPRVVYRADFLVLHNRAGIGRDIVTVEDTKGHLTDQARIKIAVVQQRYGITIRILRRADVSRA